MMSQLEWCQLSGDNCNGRIVVSVEWRSRYNDGGAWTCLLRQSIAIKLRLCRDQEKQCLLSYASHIYSKRGQVFTGIKKFQLW